LELVKDKGFDSLTMKALADKLNVTPMAIYRHVSDKSDLINSVLDAFVCDVDVCNHEISNLDWKEWLRATYTNMYTSLKGMPSLHPYLGNAPRFGPNAMEVLSKILSVLRTAGFNQQQTINATSSLTGFMIGCSIMDTAFHQSLSKSQQNLYIPSTIDSGLDHIFTALSLELEANNKTKVVS
jgi:AcrR family transcriptional regulator